MDTLQVVKIFFIRICKNLSRVPLTHSCVSSLILLKMWGNLKSSILYCCCVYVSNACYSIYWMFLIGSPCTWSPCPLQSYWGTNFPSPSLPFPVSSNTRITDLLIFFYRVIVFFHALKNIMLLLSKYSRFPWEEFCLQLSLRSTGLGGDCQEAFQWLFLSVLLSSKRTTLKKILNYFISKKDFENWIEFESLVIMPLKKKKGSLGSWKSGDGFNLCASKETLKEIIRAVLWYFSTFIW